MDPYLQYLFQIRMKIIQFSSMLEISLYKQIAWCQSFLTTLVTIESHRTFKDIMTLETSAQIPKELRCNYLSYFECSTKQESKLLIDTFEHILFSRWICEVISITTRIIMYLNISCEKARVTKKIIKNKLTQIQSSFFLKLSNFWPNAFISFKY